MSVGPVDSPFRFGAGARDQRDISGLILAHDRAIAMYPRSTEAVRSQYWMLAVMVCFTSLASGCSPTPVDPRRAPSGWSASMAIMPSLDTRLGEIFAAIVDHYDAQPPEQREALWHVRTFGEVGFNAWDEDKPVVTRDDLDALRDGDFVDIDFNTSGDYLVRPTGSGREALRTYRRELSLQQRAAPVDLS